MEKLVTKEPVPIITMLKDIIVVLLSMIAIIVSIRNCSKQNESNNLAQVANDLALKANTTSLAANRLAKEAFESSSKFDIINAETQWGLIRDAYDEIDFKILTWENSKNLKRSGKSVKSIEQLELILEALKVPSEIRRLYRIRHEKYQILMNVSDQYKPFKKRLLNIDFILPSAPVLPKVSFTGTINGTIR